MEGPVRLVQRMDTMGSFVVAVERLKMREMKTRHNIAGWKLLDKLLWKAKQTF